MCVHTNRKTTVCTYYTQQAVLVLLQVLPCVLIFVLPGESLILPLTVVVQFQKGVESQK